MKKILLYTESMRHGGAERVMSIITNSLSKKGYDVVLVTEMPIDNNEECYNITSTVKCECINIKTGNVITKNIQKIKNLKKIIKYEKPDVVLSFLGLQNIRMLLATLFLKCKKYVSVRNDPKKEYGTSFIKKTIAKILFKHADGVIFQTEDAMKYFSKKVQKKSIIIANPVDAKFFNIKQELNPCNIITVGRLEPQKNHKLLIDAYEKLEIADKLLIYGDGSLKEELNNYIIEKCLTNKVVLKGNKNNIENELKKAKIFVLSSDYEGMPNSLMEAMAIGLPCISTDCPCGGPKYLIRNENEGYLVPCNDVDKLSFAIKKMLETDYKKIGNNAKKRLEEFETNKIVEKWENYLFE